MSGANSLLHVAASRIDLDPSLGLPLMGRCRLGGLMQGRMNATGRYTPLYARCVVVRLSDQVFVLCGVDLCVVSRESVERIRRELSSLLGSRSQLTVVASHTHSAPPGWKEFGFTGREADQWLAHVERSVITAVREAFGRLEPAVLSMGRATVRDIAANRRIRMPDGRLEMNFLVDDPRRGEPCGPIDPELLVCQASSLEGRPLAVLGNFACHSNILLEREHLDYCAEPFVMTMLRYESDNLGAVGIHLPGAMGNINAFSRPLERSHRQEELMARTYHDYLNQAIASAKPVAVQTLAMLSRCIRVGTREMPPPDEIRRMLTSDRCALQSALAARDAQAVWRLERMISHREALLDLIDRGRVPNAYSLRYTVIRLGELTIVTFPGELFVEYGLKIKQEIGPRPCMVIGYADDYLGYFPTRRAFEEGGYESMPSIYSLTVAGAGDHYVADVLKAMDHFDKKAIAE